MSTAITYARYGGPEVLTVSEVDVPEPGPGQVRIAVRAVGINLIDLKIRRGALDGVFPARFPMTPGWDVAGVVDAVGEGASQQVGDEVFGVATGNGYAQYALLDRPLPKPAALSFELAAAMPTVGETAYRTLRHLDVRSGQTVLVHGGGGSVGSLAVQLAVAQGLRVVTTAHERDHERLTALGAIPVGYGEGWVERVRAVAPQGVDAVVDASGAGVLPESIELTGDAAKVITIADEGAAQYGVRFTGADPTDRFPESVPRLADQLADGTLRLDIGHTYPLVDAAKAHRDIEAHRYPGKIVLLP